MVVLRGFGSLSSAPVPDFQINENDENYVKYKQKGDQ